MKITDFRKYLQSLSKEEMETELLNLVKTYKDVKEYFSLKVNPEGVEEIFLKYKEKNPEFSLGIFLFNFFHTFNKKPLHVDFFTIVRFNRLKFWS